MAKLAARQLAWEWMVGLGRRWTDSLIYVALAMAGVALSGCAGGGSDSPAGAAARQTKPPNIVFLLIDALRADRLTSYGCARGLSPMMDELSAEAVTFDLAVAQAPWTQPSVASLFCSMHPTVHQVVRYGAALGGAFEGGPKIRVFAEQFETLAEVFQKNGYDTAAFVANPFIVKEFGFAQGFAHFDASFAKNTTPGSVVSAAAVDWLRQRDTTRPFFLYLHYMDVHGPYDASPEYLDPLLDALEGQPDKRQLTAAEWEGLNYLRQQPARVTDIEQHKRLLRYREYWVARYDAGVREQDRHLDDLRNQLVEMGLWNDAYVILTADHGEALCEHGLWEHGFSVHHTDLHVPLIMRWPGVLPAGKRVPGVVSLVDVMPTLLEQLHMPPVLDVQGASLVPLMSGEAAGERRPAFAEAVKSGPEQKAVYFDAWKLMILGTRPPGRLLYNIAADPHEAKPTPVGDGTQYGRLADRLKRHLSESARLAASVQVQETPVTPEQQARLRALGYVTGGSGTGEGVTGAEEGPPPPP
ncbi:MAG: sulfatase [Planctomycetes bacterium]|nr:sulfatase [Planctomycetota bacterium]